MKTRLFIFIFISIAVNSFTQGNYTVNVQYFGQDEGLPFRSSFIASQDTLGFIWLDNGGLTRFDGHQFKRIDWKKYGFTSSIVTLIHRDGNGCFWIVGGRSSGGKVRLEQRELNIFNPYTYEAKSLPAYLPSFPRQELDNVQNIFRHPDGTIFIQLLDERIFEYHPSTGLKTTNINTDKYKKARLQDDDAQKVYNHLENYGINVSENVLGLQNPTTGNYWLYDFVANFLLIVHPEKGIIYDFKDTHPEIANSGIMGLFVDKQNNAWACTEFGVYKIRLVESPFRQYLAMPLDEYGPRTAFSSRAISVTGNEMWVNSNLQNQYIVNLKTGEKEPAIEGLDDILVPIIQTDDDEYLAASKMLLQIKDRKIQKSYPWKNNEDYVNWSIFKDSREQIYLGTDVMGLAHLENDSIVFFKKWNEFKELEFAFVLDFLPWNDEETIVASQFGLYVLHTEKGITHRLELAENTKTELSNSIHYIHLHIDKDNPQVIWAATNEGLLQLMINDKWEITDYKQFTIADGLADDMLYAVYEDANGNLWMPSNYGIIRFNKNTYNATSYTVRDGITFNEFNRTSHYQDENGILYFGSMNGVTVFNPDEVLNIQKDFNIPLRIADFQQYNGNTNQFEDRTELLLEQHEIVLRPNDKLFKLSFSLLEYVDASKVKYSYRIEGTFDEWIYLDDNQLNVSGLPYGHHTLEIRAQGVSGQVSTSRLEIPIKVLRPFYLQWWFTLSLFLIGVSAIYLWYQRRTQQLKLRQKELEETVEERTAQIKKDKFLIEQQAAELRNLDQVKSRFFANISHEFRTPLTLMLAPIREAIDNNQYSEKDITNLKIAQRNGKQLQKMVNEILDLTKLEAGKLELEYKTVSWYTFLSAHLAGFESLADIKGLEYKFDYIGHEYLQLKIDSNKIATILSNLLSNAFKFTEEGSIHVISEYDNGLLTLQVKDTGRGIHPEDLPNVFNRFYQSRNKKAVAEGGTGIGLSLVQELVQLMDGIVQVESTLGEGTSFIAKIPATRIFNKLEDSKAIAIQKALDNPVGTKPKEAVIFDDEKPTIMLVEDNPDLTLFIKSILEDQYNVITAENGKVALERLQVARSQLPIDINNIKERLTGNSQPVTRNPQLIISDVMMPIMDGFQLLEKVKDNTDWQNTPFIMLTARSAMEDKINALRIGVDDYLTKPFVKEELLVRIENLLKNANNRLVAKQEEQVETPAFSEPVQEWLNELEALIIKNIDNIQLNVDDLADAMNMSKRQFYRDVKKYIGQTPHQYLKTYRLNYARQLLETKKYDTVKRVAYAVAFPDRVYFSKEFKKAFGKLPSEYL